MTDAELKARPGSGADKGISKYSGSGIRAAQRSFDASQNRQELERLGEKAWNDYVIRYHSMGLRDFDKKLRKDKGEDLNQVKEVFIQAFINTNSPERAWDDTSKFMYNYLNDISFKYSNKSGVSTEYLQSVGQERGLVSAYNEWNRTANRDFNIVKPEESKAITAQDAEAMSRPGSGADKGIGRDSGKEIKEAQADAFMKGQKEAAGYENKTGIDIAPDETLSSYADAVEQAQIINQITGVTVAPENRKAVKQAVEKLINDGNYADAKRCKQAAVNIEYIWKKDSGTTDGDKIYPLFMYIKNILDFNWFGDKQTFGKAEEEELKKLYKSIEKRYASIGGLSPSEKMRLLKDISDAYKKEWAWYESLGDNDDAAVHNSESRQGLEKDDKSGYRGMWVNGTENALDGLLDLNTAVLTIDAYLSTRPWPSSDPVDDEHSMTWKQLFEGLKEKLSTPTSESMLQQAKNKAFEQSQEDLSKAGVAPQGEVLPESDKEDNGTIGEKAKSAAKAAGKSFTSGKGLLGVGKDAIDAWRGNKK